MWLSLFIPDASTVFSFSLSSWCQKAGWTLTGWSSREHQPHGAPSGVLQNCAGFPGCSVFPVNLASSLTPLLLVSVVLMGRMFYFLPSRPSFLYHRTPKPLIWSCYEFLYLKQIRYFPTIWYKDVLWDFLSTWELFMLTNFTDFRPEECVLRCYYNFYFQEHCWSATLTLAGTQSRDANPHFTTEPKKGRKALKGQGKLGLRLGFLHPVQPTLLMMKSQAHWPCHTGTSRSWAESKQDSWCCHHSWGNGALEVRLSAHRAVPLRRPYLKPASPDAPTLSTISVDFHFSISCKSFMQCLHPDNIKYLMV